MSTLLFRVSLFAAMAISAVAVDTCASVPAPHDMPSYGMRWIEAPGCVGCQGDHCLGCRSSNTSTCARCVYDVKTCQKGFGAKECRMLQYGASVRGDTCKGTAMPFAGGLDGFPFGLMPGDDIPELTGTMTIPEARNQCANYRNASGDQTCIAFTWNVTQETPVVDENMKTASPQACPPDPPANGIMWVAAPNCVGCKGDYCLGCEKDASSDCARCVYDEVACDASSTGTIQCNKLLYGAALRNETDCHAHPTPAKGYHVLFKSAFHPKPHRLQGAAVSRPATDTGERSDRRSYDPNRSKKVRNFAPPTENIELDSAFPGCLQPSCTAFSYCPGDDPINSAIQVYFGTNDGGEPAQLGRDGQCFTYNFWPGLTEETDKQLAAFVV